MTEEKVPTAADHEAMRNAVAAALKEAGYEDFEWHADIFDGFRFETRDATKKVGYRKMYTGKVQIVLYNNRSAEKRWTPTLTKKGELPASTKKSLIETVKAFDEQTRDTRELRARIQVNEGLAKDILDKTSWLPYWVAASYNDRRKVENLIGQPYSGPPLSVPSRHHLADAPKVNVSLSIPVDTKEGKALANTISDLVLEYLKSQMAEKA